MGLIRSFIHLDEEMFLNLYKALFIHLDEEMFLNLYKALLRPHLEYANFIWHPIKIKDITAIENVQKWATKYLLSLKGLSCEERLQKLKLPTLRYRRLRGDMIETYKLMTGKYDYEIVDMIAVQVYQLEAITWSCTKSREEST